MQQTHRNNPFQPFTKDNRETVKASYYDILIILRHNICRWCKIRGITICRLSKEVGVSKEALYELGSPKGKIKKMIYFPGTLLIAHIASYLKVDISELFTPIPSEEEVLTLA